VVTKVSTTFQTLNVNNIFKPTFTQMNLVNSFPSSWCLCKRAFYQYYVLKITTLRQQSFLYSC